MLSNLLIEEERLYAVTGNVLGIEVAEELEEHLPLLWHGLAWLHPGKVLLVIPACTIEAIMITR